MLQRLKRAIARRLVDSRPFLEFERRFADFGYATIAAFIHEYSKRHKEVFFIQVGGNDGITWDPFHHFIVRDHWRGIIIEPQQHVFEQKLSATYRANPRVQLLNVAVDTHDGRRPLYKFSFSSARWAEGMASFDREHLVRNLDTPWVQENLRRDGIVLRGSVDDAITSELVECLSFQTLLDRLGDVRVDFLITDVEGFDIPILNTFPLDRRPPANIIFELSTEIDGEALRFLNRLRGLGYSLLVANQDVVAVLNA